jgi:hypothetical protein
MAVHRHYPRNKIPLSVTLEAWLFLASILGAIILVKTGIIPQFLAHVHGYEVLTSFISGFFFTSVLTTAPATVALVEAASYIPAWKLALFGGLGAACGDLLVFRFVQSKLVEYLLSVVFRPSFIRTVERISRGPFWWLGSLLGAAVIASPLPDELGLLLMGLARISMWQLIPLALAANTIGIYLIALTALHFA